MRKISKDEKRMLQYIEEKTFKLAERIKSANDVLYETMDSQSFNTFLSMYLDVFVESKKSPEKLRKIPFYHKIDCNLQEARNLLEQNLNRILFAHDNMSVCARSPEDIPMAVKKVEDDFDKDVEKAKKYFGESFLRQRLKQMYGVRGCFEYPGTVQELLEDKRRYEWDRHTIKNGFPKVYNYELYRDSLPRIIAEYFDAFEKSACEKAQKNENA